MSIQFQHAVAARPESQPERADVAADRALLRALLVAGARGAAPALTTAALLHYWRALRLASVTQRRWVVDELRAAVRRGETTARAWLPVGLGETDPALVREAVLGYLGQTPVSIERRECAASDALDWIRRGLALNRVAVFVALLQLGDVAINERLAGLRGRLTAAETAAVWCEFRDSTARRAATSSPSGGVSPEASGAHCDAVAAADGAGPTVRSQLCTSCGLRSVSHANTSACHATRCT